jgi:hypothetical protein
MHNSKYFILILFSFFLSLGYGQQPQEEEVPVILNIKRLLPIEMSIIVRDGAAYFPAKEIFEYLGIKAEIDMNRIYIDGYIENPDSTFFIDYPNKSSKKNNKRFLLTEEDGIIKYNNLYLREGFLNEFFRLGINYNARRLTISVDSTKKIPILKYFLLKNNFQARQKKKEFEIPPPDVIYEPEPLKTGAGRLNWNIISRYNSIGLYSNYNFNLQSKIAGGDLDLYLRGVSRPNKSFKPNLRGQYRIAFPDNKYISQVLIGQNIKNGLFYYDVLGVEINNRPISGRSIQAIESFEGVTNPNSFIELVGRLRGGAQLVQAQNSGSFKFDLPLRYGPTQFQASSFDKYGWFGATSYFNNIPQSMLPAGVVEYSSAIGKITSVSGQYIFTNSINFGVSSWFTMGGMLDYYDVAGIPNKLHGALTSTAHILRSLNLTSMVSPNAYSKFNLHWLASSVSEFSITRSYFVQNTPRNFGNALNQWEITASASLIKSNKLRMAVNGSHTQYSNYQDYTVEGTVIGTAGNVTPSITSRITQSDISNSMETRSHYTELNISAILPLNLLVHGGLSYNHLSKDIQTIRVSAQRTFFRNLNIRFSILRYPTIPTGLISLDVRYIFPFLDVRTNVSRNDEREATYGLNVIGSMGFDIPKGSFSFSRTQAQRFNAGFSFHPFIDENNNDIRDEGEQIVNIGKISLQDNTLGSSPVAVGRDKFILDRLGPYKTYTVYLDPTSIDDPRIVPRYNAIKINSDAYYIRDIDIPLVYGSTIRGVVTDETSKPIEGVSITLTPILIDMKDPEKFIKKTVTFSTGEYEFTLLSPGKYKIEIDPSIAKNNGFSAKPSRREITLVSRVDGDLYENQNFQLIKKK